MGVKLNKINKKLAFLCFVPDAGHIIPLIRNAKLAMDEGFEIKFYVPIEAKPLFNGVEFPVHYLLPVLSDNEHLILASICNASVTYRELFLKYKFRTYRNIPLMYNVYNQIDIIKDQVKDFDPIFIFADDLLLSLAYEYVSSYCNVPLVLHNAFGSNVACQIDNKGNTTYPWADFFHRSQLKLLVQAAKLTNPIQEKWLRLTNKSAWKRQINQRRTLNQSNQKYKKYISMHPTHVSHITTGLGIIEKEFLSHKVNVCQDIKLYPSMPPLQSEKLPVDINEWLEKDVKRNVLYVCFGTMITPPGKLANILRLLAEELDIRILWASKRSPIEQSSSSLGDDYFLWKKWVPQTSILAHKSVIGFLTHAGGGSIQEAIWYGKPVLCMPKLWDQPYNAWMTENLGCGINLYNQKITKSKLERVLHELLIERKLDADTQKLQKIVKQRSKAFDFGMLIADIASID